MKILTHPAVGSAICVTIIGLILKFASKLDRTRSDALSFILGFPLAMIFPAYAVAYALNNWRLRYLSIGALGWILLSTLVCSAITARLLFDSHELEEAECSSNDKEQ